MIDQWSKGGYKLEFNNTRTALFNYKIRQLLLPMKFSFTCIAFPFQPYIYWKDPDRCIARQLECFIQVLFIDNVIYIIMLILNSEGVYRQVNKRTTNK